MTVCNETCINRSCSKAEPLLRRTGTFDPICFLYVSLSHISKAEIVKRILLQTDFFQSSNKNVTCPTRTQLKVFGISEKQRVWIFLSIFSKRNVFFYNLTQQLFFDFILQFLKKCDTSEYNSTY